MNSETSRRLVAIIPVGVAVVLGWLTSGYIAAGQIRSASSGVYTDEQAAEGERSYQKECASCHGLRLAGGDYAPPLIARAFANRWQNRSVGEFFAFVQQTMPKGEPGTLTADVYAVVVAYLLEVNGYPAGPSKLGNKPSELSDITFAKP